MAKAYEFGASLALCQPIVGHAGCGVGFVSNSAESEQDEEWQTVLFWTDCLVLCLYQAKGLHELSDAKFLPNDQSMCPPIGGIMTRPDSGGA